MKTPEAYKTRSTLSYVISILLYLAVLISIIFGDFTYVTVILLGLGSTFLCLGSSYLKKSKNSDDQEK